MSVRLDSLSVGDLFLWCDVRFELRSKEPVATSEGPRLRVIYRQAAGRPDATGQQPYGVGSRGLMPPEEQVEPIVDPEKRAYDDGFAAGRASRDAELRRLEKELEEVGRRQPRVCDALLVANLRRSILALLDGQAGGVEKKRDECTRCGGQGGGRWAIYDDQFVRIPWGTSVPESHAVLEGTCGLCGGTGEAPGERGQ